MRKSTIVKIVLAAIVIVPLFAFVHYWTPRTEIIKLTQANPFRGSASASGGSKDAYEIYGVTPDGRHTVEYENNDFPLYLKFDSTSVQSQAANILSASDENQRYAAVTIIGWRIPILDMLPNTLAVKRANPDDSVFPTLTVVFWAIILGAIGGVWFTLSRWKARRQAKAAAAAAARVEADRIRSEAAKRQNVSEAEAADRFINGQ